MLNETVSRTRVLTLVIGALGSFLALSAKAPTPPVKHGLTGNYYIANIGYDTDTPPNPGGLYFVQVGSNKNNFQLPRTFADPATTRVDSQIAFGQGKGFSAKPNGPPVIWWPTGFTLPQGWPNPNDKPWNHLATVIWKGYIHLPKAGTYYFGTISNGASAVYLNQARVALNGIAGGVLVSDAFSYAKEDVQDFVQNLSYGREDVFSDARPGNAYVVPVSIEAPRDLPIEVQYNPMGHFTHWASDPLGIDLFWVTPDSPRDANGKPIAKILPGDALYSDPPSQIEKPAVRSANSMLGADFLYFPAQSTDQPVTLTVRLADKDGNPVAGKRVYVSTLVSFANGDAIVQPEKPTDEKGETTAKIRANAALPYPHDSTIFATDVTDFVDVAQVGHVRFVNASSSFFPDAYAPYYDGKVFQVEPLPFRVGQRETFRVPLVNRLKNTAEVAVSLKAHGFNIGTSDWEEIGRSETFRLKPGESREVSISWTPEKESGHLCFRMDVIGRLLTADSHKEQELAASLVPMPPSFVAFPAPASGDAPLTSVQRNLGPVAPPPCGRPTFGSTPVPINPSPCKPGRSEQNYCKAELDQVRQAIAFWTAQMESNIRGGAIKLAQSDLKELQYLEELERALEKCANDPPEPAYRRLTVAVSDTPAAYMEAATKSWERYQEAEAQGDPEWVARQFTAQVLYLQRHAQALRTAADDAQKQAESLPQDDPRTLARIQAQQDQFVERWRRGERFTPDEIKVMKEAGVSEEEPAAAIETLLGSKEIPPAKSLRTRLLEVASLYRESANQAEQIANAPANFGEEGKSGQPLIQTYGVGNPHNKEENVDLLIRPISIPPHWKLSIVNAEQVEASGQTAKPRGDAPKFPVREAEAGKHYSVTLPAKAEVKVASVVIPVGEIGAHTTARWAVEGKIGDELIGGMVHEMNVPYIIADLQLPPVGSKEVEEELAAPSKAWPRVVAEVAAAIVILGLLAYFFIFWRRRRQTGTPAAS